MVIYINVNETCDKTNEEKIVVNSDLFIPHTKVW